MKNSFKRPGKKGYRRDKVMPAPEPLVAQPVAAYTPPAPPAGPVSRGYMHNPLFRGVPMLNTTLIPPLVPMGDKELQFADMVWSGLTPYIAFLQVYGHTNKLEKMLHLDVNRKLWTRSVRMRLHQLDKMACDMDTKNAENRRNFVLDGLTSLASDDSISPMARLKALELLGKVRGTDLFTDRVEQVTSSMSEEQVRQALAEKLAQLGVGAITATEELSKEIKVIEHEPK